MNSDFIGFVEVNILIVFQILFKFGDDNCLILTHQSLKHILPQYFLHEYASAQSHLETNTGCGVLCEVQL